MSTPPAVSLLAGSGQSPRLTGADRAAALHDQLYRYAEDLQQMVERNSVLEANYQAVRESCLRLTESRHLLDDLIGHSRDMHLVTDVDGRILQCNPATAALAPSTSLPGTLLRDWILPSHRANHDALLLRANADGLPGEEWELRLRRDGVDLTPVIVSAQAISVSRSPSARQVHWILRDITRLREIQFETQLSSMVFQSAAEGVLITDVEGEILAVNPAFCSITGYAAEEVVGRRPSMISSGMHDGEFYAAMWRTLRETGSWQGEIYNRRKNGEVFPEWLTISAARDGEGRVLSYIGVFSDLSRLLQSERRWAYLAHHDTLTGLPNRLLLQDRLVQALVQARRTGAHCTLIFIDLDRFKQINDRHGHEVGDRVLVMAAQRLGDTVRESDTVARLGGDEFVILAPGLSGTDDLGRLAAKVIAALCQPMDVGGLDLQLGASLGCATYPAHGKDDASLLKAADLAMYRAKEAGGNIHVIAPAVAVTAPAA